MISSLFSVALLASAAVASPLVLRSPDGPNKAIIEMFQWNWDSIKAECAWIGKAGYGYVQVSPVAEHIAGDQWWVDYQVVSYNVASKRGNRDQFKSMIDTCHAQGVKIIVDIVLNHMAGIDSGTGSGGSSFTHYNYPGTYIANDFNYCTLKNYALTDWNNQYQLENCQLFNLADLKTSSEYVRQRLAQHTNDLLDLGVDGFRLDAAKHIPVADMQNILGRLNRKVFITQEVPDAAGTFSSMHAVNGDIQEYRFGWGLKGAFLNTGVVGLMDISSRGWMPSNQATVFVAQHDTERDGTTLSASTPREQYTLAHVFMLAYGYGTPTILSSYDWSNKDASGPNGNYGACAGNAGSKGWKCQHRWTPVAGMVGFYNQVGSSEINNVQKTNSRQQIAFGRGNLGHVIINNADSTWSTTFKTKLPAGIYCDVFSGKKDGNKCTRKMVHVSNSGTFWFSVPARSAVAVHAGTKLT